MVVVALLSVDLVESVDLVSVDLVVNCTVFVRRRDELDPLSNVLDTPLPFWSKYYFISEFHLRP